MRVVFISDTHTLHDELYIPSCDLLIHAGDYSSRGSKRDTASFLEWFDRQPAEHKIFIDGNHDISGDPKFMRETNADIWFDEIVQKYSGSITRLINNGTETCGLKVWGSPATPWFHGDYWAYNYYRGEEIRKVWDQIPEGLDILITHGPPKGIFDLTPTYTKAGCEELREAVKLKKPKIHVFGHIHQDDPISHIMYRDGTLFINAAILNNQYNQNKRPVIIDL